MDYGHPLRFGTFITPTSADPQVPVGLAQLSEQLGYDLVTFQDHPYQPAFLDSWTLLSYVAAATSTIQIAPNVTNLPLRPAPVLARAAASLDLLSGGRLELGLGAGGFWDPIVAMGGDRLTPGQSVDALSEAVDLIRDFWNVGESGVLRGGDHYRVDGAKRGPAPAHDIGIWIGAYKPRMLRLTGQKADGWLPSLGYLKPGALSDGNARIDDAATDAGRMPTEVARLLNISGNESVDQLLALALGDGISTFIVGSDDPTSLQRFAESTIPALRAAVTAERGESAVATGTSRSSRALAARMPDIAYDEIPASLRESAVEPGDLGYHAVKSTYMRAGTPGLVLRPTTVAQVQDAVKFALEHRELPLGIRSGGHGISGRSTNAGGLIIDLHAIADIEVLDEATRRVRVGPGATWSQVAQALQSRGWALSSGDYGGVGVGGLATAGGIGFLGRDHGLTIDRLVAADVVLSDGTVARASATENPDLFWAVRGAGANVGIVTAFEFEAALSGDVGWVQLRFDASDLEGFLSGFGAAQESAPRDVTMFLIVVGGGDQVNAQMYGVVNQSDPETIIERLQPFAQVGPLVGQQVQLAPYAAIMQNASDAIHDGRGEPDSRSMLVRHLDAPTVAAMAAFVRSGASPWFQIRSMGGAIGDVGSDETAFSQREANFSVAAMGHSAEFDRQWSRLEEHSVGLYLSFETRTGSEVTERAFPRETLERLRTAKATWDPEGLFRDNFPVD